MTIITKKSAMLLVVLAVAVSGLVLKLDASVTTRGALKLEGAWVARVVNLEGTPGVYPFQWSYTLAPDTSGRRATIHGTVDVGFPDNPLLPHDFSTPIIGEMVQTGPDTVDFDSYWYAIAEGPINQIVYIGRAFGTATLLEPGIFEVEHNFQVFLPSADVDGDGFPEGAPVNEFSAITRDTRIPSPGM